MFRIELTGLRADAPIGVMAAFGCLRVCQRSERLAGSKLSYARSGSSFHAVLWTREETSHAELIGALVRDVGGAPTRKELTWHDQIKTADAGLFRAAAKGAIDTATPETRETSDWFAAFGSELVTNEGKVESTPFDMTVARQRFLADALKLAALLAAPGRKGKSAEESYREALFGPWKYEDDQHSLGWDPSSMKLGAFTFRAPTGMANAGVRAAVWLAFESLPLFPCFWAGSLRTRAFSRSGRELGLCWPVWHPPIGVAELECLLGMPVVVSRNPRTTELKVRGIMALYRCAQYKPNKYLFGFRAPELVYGEQAAAALVE